MSRTIVVAISESSTEAFLASALDAARNRDAHIVAVHIVNLTPCFTGMGDFDYGLIVSAMEEAGQAVLARAMRILEGNRRGAEARLLMSPLSGSTIGRQIAAVCDGAGAERVLLGMRKPGWWHFMNEDVAATAQRHTSTLVQIVGQTRSAPSARRSLDCERCAKAESLCAEYATTNVSSHCDRMRTLDPQGTVEPRQTKWPIPD